MQRSPRRSTQEWQSLVNRQQASGQTAPQFCAEHQISYVSFSKWRKRLTDSKPDRSADTPPVFVELTQAHPPAQQWIAELDLGTGAVLRIAKA